MLADYGNPIDIGLWIWVSLTAVSVAYVSWDLITRTPEMKVMKWGWILVTLYTGPVAFIVYWFSCREPVPNAHETFILPLWKQSVGSTIHCMAGDATGIIFAAAITSGLGLPMGVDAAIEYSVGFAFGLFIFQALFLKDLLGLSYWGSVKATLLPEWLSMNAVMAGMIPIMVILMTTDMRAMEPTSLRFWGVMSLASLVGAALAYPVNWWLVDKGLKHGMGTERVLGKGGMTVDAERVRLFRSTPAIREFSEHIATEVPASFHNMKAIEENTPTRTQNGAAQGASTAGPRDMSEMISGGVASTQSKFLIALITIGMLVGGVSLAALYGDFSMRAVGTAAEPMSMQ